MRLLNGAAVEPDADGCCVGLKGAGDTFALCMTEPTTSGLIATPETGEFAWSFTCDRHTGVAPTPPIPRTNQPLPATSRARNVKITNCGCSTNHATGM